jgi:MFS family permease
MSPVGRLVLLRVASKTELVSAMAWLMIPASIGAIAGPPVGGFLVTYLSWRWIFYINVPIGLAGIVFASLFIEETREPAPGHFDFLGLALCGTALACLTFGIEIVSSDVGSHLASAALLAACVFGAGLYVLHARRHPRPLLDVGLMRIATFRASVVSGSLARIAVGAFPLLLPTMLQLGFGVSALRSGMITFVIAIGSLPMRFSAAGVLRRLGFRTVLVWVGLLAALLVATCAGFRPDWPLSAIYGVLLLLGFFQSLQFIAYNTIAYADVPGSKMSAATSFYTMFQQMTLSLGVAVSAAVLAAAVSLRGHSGPQFADFSVAFLSVAAIASVAPLLSLRLDKDAGAELSSRRASPVKAHAAAAE